MEKKSFVPPTLTEEASLSDLTQQQVVSGGTAPPT
jgi:hypothetical protein